MEKTILKQILSHLQSGHVTIWTQETNSGLQAAEQLLEKEKVPYEAIVVDKEFLGEQKKAIIEALFEYTHTKLFPSVFVGNDFLGNFSDLECALKSGELKKSLKDQASL